jgi:peptide deformylase
MITIVDKNDPILRKIAKPVALKDIKSSKIKKVIRDMKTALDSQEDGVAIAAPQIGASFRIFIISPKVFDIISQADDAKRPASRHVVCINPSIVKSSREKAMVEEGCLSVRYLYGDVKRSEKVKIRATDERGRTAELGGSGLLAQIFQHEIDHLNGILFIDKAVGVRDMPPHTHD